MIQIHWIFPLIACAMIAALGGWIFVERCQRRHALKSAEHERERIRKIAEEADSKATSCAAVIDLIKPEQQPQQPRLQVVRDNQKGISKWEWH